MGLFAFEQVDKRINLCMATNPKEYLELVNEDEYNLKHKGVKKDSLGMSFEEYVKRIQPLSVLKKKKKLWPLITYYKADLRSQTGL